mmetsp:Transcript_22998/g.44689  ORF Transcript_22998/g.44689 Transcript_22998/m.44689 type:complete len:141 (+) Transcript_22998:829-1251(+)
MAAGRGGQPVRQLHGAFHGAATDITVVGGVSRFHPHGHAQHLRLLLAGPGHALVARADTAQRLPLGGRGARAGLSETPTGKVSKRRSWDISMSEQDEEGGESLEDVMDTWFGLQTTDSMTSKRRRPHPPMGSPLGSPLQI